MNDAQAALVVCDAGPVIHLDQLDCLDLLADFSKVVILTSCVARWNIIAPQRSLKWLASLRG